MEQIADTSVRGAPQPVRMANSHKRRARCSPTLKFRLAGRIQKAIYGRPIEEIRRRLGDAEDSGSTSRDISNIRSGRPARIEVIGFERLLCFCEAFGIDPAEAMQPAPARLQ